MKKVFVEPEMQIIELNLKENIAASAQVSMGYYFLVDLFGCWIVDTGKYVNQIKESSEADGCLAIVNTRRVMRFYPREEVIPYFGR